MTRPTSNTTELQGAVAALHAGQAIGLPTETVYGLAADADNPAAVARIFSLKQRPADHPLIVHIAGVEQLARYARDIPESAYQLADAFWPGPLTLILKRNASVSDVVTGGQDSIGLRAPAHPVARAVLHAFGHGLAAPSANRFGRISPTRAAHVREEFGAAVPVVLDGGDCQIGIESTIIDLTATPPRILRPGRIHAEDIASIIGPVAVGAGDNSPRAPGNLESHYAPVTPLHLTSREHLSRQPDQPALTIGKLPDNMTGIALSIEPKAYARELYAALRTMDQWGADRINAEIPPDNEEWRAVNDRLRRAASTNVSPSR